MAAPDQINLVNLVLWMLGSVGLQHPLERLVTHGPREQQVGLGLGFRLLWPGVHLHGQC